MATDITEGFKKAYSDYFEQVLQVQDTRLKQAVSMATGYRGEKVQPVKRIGTFEFAERTQRMQPTIYVEPGYSARAIAPRTWQVTPIFDRTDQFFLGFSPQGAIATEGRSAENRKVDSIIAGAFFSTALTGKDGGTSTVFDATNSNVGINTGGSNTGFNYAKFLAGREILGRNQALNNGETAWVLLSYAQETKFLQQLEVISSEYRNAVRMDEGGHINGFMGVNFITGDYAELLPSANLRYVPMWVPSGMHYGVWDGVVVKFDEVQSMSYAPSIFHEFTANATRLDEKRVIRIDCYE
jgi:hypothetical protein